MIANELISAALACKLGFPVSELELAQVTGPDSKKRNGIVSIKNSAQEVITWAEADNKIHKNPDKYIYHLNLLRYLLVFDAWIVNIDRAMGKNLILYRNQKDHKYRWYLIDHGNCLFGSPRKWKRYAGIHPFGRKYGVFIMCQKAF